MATATRERSSSRTRSDDRDRSAAATAASAPAPGPVSPRLKSLAGGPGSRLLRQLVLVQAAAAAVLAGWVAGGLWLVPAGALAAVLVVVALIRRQGRSLPDWFATTAALRARRRQAASTPVPPGTEPGFAPAVECDPALRTYSFGGRDRRSVGMLGDGGFVTAVLQVETDATAIRADRGARPLPVALVRDALEVDDIRLESAQIVLHTQPAPALHLPQNSIAVTNYAPLQAQSGAPAVRISWIALKLDPELCAEAVAARGGGLTGAQKCLVRVTDHLASRLTGAGFRTTVLTEEGIAAAVATSACANPLVTAQAGRDELPSRRTEESARSWRCDNRRHTTYWIRRWPGLGSGGASLPQLVAALSATPALATTFSLTLARGDNRETTIRGHVRVTGRGDAELVAARRDLEQAARRGKVALARLDREQLPGVLATLPLGGTR
ncbi:type VII secretion protein EccE [Streptomyces sp. NA04227]|uniref:type VII secretion protein EccE n=1 Tax=Streptomyces sp. NA04227 TaxID=2742136 RepID=UPI001590552A|nr:type VII secretion protein EccE [Streptomyces sp. NA04227]QKW09511.1 type VII secretion protein EccE [Streptomyces sp. NA04227]